MFLEELGIKESGLDQLIRTSYDLLGLATYFTAGVQEVRAWTFRKGMKAPQCAGIIHTDFERGFIRAETVAYDDLLEAGSQRRLRKLVKYVLKVKNMKYKMAILCYSALMYKNLQGQSKMVALFRLLSYQNF